MNRKRLLYVVNMVLMMFLWYAEIPNRYVSGLRDAVTAAFIVITAFALIVFWVENDG